MLAAIYTEDGNLEVTEYPVREFNDGEVLIEVNSCGICGTDHHILEGKAFAKSPVILGHEYSGTVVDYASDVKGISPGDKVVVDPNIYCGNCNYCRKGMVHFCNNLQALGVTQNGGFAEYSVVPVSQIYTLPKEFDLAEAAFAEPLSCCLRGIQQAEIKVGNSVAIIGGGSIGLLMLQLAKLSGAAKTILIEPIKKKRDLGFKLGADLVINPAESDAITQLVDFTDGGFDVVIECVGSSDTVEMSIDLVDKGGTIVIFGLAPAGDEAKIDLQKIFQKEIRIHNSLLNPFTFETAVNLLISGKINVSYLLTHQTPLKNIKEVINRNDLSGYIKMQVTNKTRRSNVEIFYNN